MASAGKAPPVFKEGSSYAQWKHALSAWKILTGIEKEKQALSVYLHGLDPVYQEVISKLDINLLNHEGGVKLITDTLDVYCESELSQRQYNTYEHFCNVRRKDEQPLNEFIMSFENIINDLEELHIDLPEAVKAYHVLRSSNIGQDNEKICRATVGKQLTYENMITQIKTVTGSVGKSASASSVKTEPTDSATADTFYSRGLRSGRGRYVAGRRGSNSRGARSNSYSSNNWNSTYRDNSSRNTSPRCFSCGSSDHLSYDCPSGGKTQDQSSGNKRNLRCFKCNRLGHFAYECNSQISQGDAENVNIVLLESLSRNDSFLAETFLAAVIDSGARANVAGELWISNYIESLDENDMEMISEDHCVSKFRFGGGVEVVSDVKITLPVYIGGTRQFLKTAVVKKELPLLLSFESLHNNKVVIDFGNLQMWTGNAQVKLESTNSGHVLLPLSKKRISEDCKYTLYVKNLTNLSDIDKEKKMYKLHRQMGHASKGSLLKLLSTSGLKEKGLVDALMKVIDNCDVCIKHKPKPLRPCVAEPLAEDFNQTVALDLKTHVKDQVYVLHLIDLGSKYSAACVIRNKKSETIVQGVMKIWVHYFGPPRRFLTDNGGGIQ